MIGNTQAQNILESIEDLKREIGHRFTGSVDKRSSRTPKQFQQSTFAMKREMENTKRKLYRQLSPLAKSYVEKYPDALEQAAANIIIDGDSERSVLKDLEADAEFVSIQFEPE